MTFTEEFSDSYIRLRTLLDSLQANSLRYVMKAESTDERLDRIGRLEGEIRSLVKEIGGEGPCADGYYLCYGVCVPYQCVGQSESQSASMLLED
jgi:hypothetical protein